MLVPIIIAIVALIAITILLKVCAKFYTLNLILLIAAGVGIIVSSFAMPEQNSLNWNWIIPQAVCIFLFDVMLWADIAFDKEEYVNTTVTEHWDGSVTASSRLENKSMFWGTIGGGLAIAAFLVFLNYMIFETHAIALGVVGCLATGWAAIMLIKYILMRVRAKRRRNNNYYG